MIRGYVGEFGSGKTLNMIWDAVQAMQRGRKIVTNTPIKIEMDGWWGRKYWLTAKHIQDADEYFEHLAYDMNCIFLVDEAGVYFPNQFWNKFPPVLIAKLNMQRKFHTDFWYTVPRQGHVVKKMRDLAHVLIKCSKQTIIPEFRIFRRHFSGIQIYRARRFSPEYFEGAQNAKKYERYYRGTRTMWPSQVRRAYRAYDTEWIVDASALMNLKNFMKRIKQMKTVENPEELINDEKPEISEATTSQNRREVDIPTDIPTSIPTPATPVNTEADGPKFRNLPKKFDGRVPAVI